MKDDMIAFKKRIWFTYKRGMLEFFPIGSMWECDVCRHGKEIVKVLEIAKLERLLVEFQSTGKQLFLEWDAFVKRIS